MRQPYQRRPWQRRGQQHHLSPDEIKYVEQSCKDKISPTIVARKLGCSERTISWRYARFRGDVVKHRGPRSHKKTIAERRSRATLPDRHYHGNFDL